MVTPLQYSFAWQIPWMEEPGRLQSMGSLRVGHNWATSFSLFTFMHWRRKWQPPPVFLPGESQGLEAWWAAVYAVAQSRTRLKWLRRRRSPLWGWIPLGPGARSSAWGNKWEQKSTQLHTHIHTHTAFVWIWHPQNSCCKPNVQCDDIRRWAFGR